MEKQEKMPQISPEQAKRLLSSPEARQLIALLNRDGGMSLQKAAAEFRKGNTAGAQEALKPMMQTQEAGELLEKLKGK